jgi:hypothetical protein
MKAAINKVDPKSALAVADAYASDSRRSDFCCWHIVFVTSTFENIYRILH